jgi:hypothetical protein
MVRDVVERWSAKRRSNIDIGEANMSVAGTYDCVAQTPMGAQNSVLTVTVEGNSWTGSNAGQMGSMSIYDGTIDGSTITWKMDMTVPMPMTLEGTATISGDTITGSIKAGAFGAFPLTGTRKA